MGSSTRTQSSSLQITSSFLVSINPETYHMQWDQELLLSTLIKYYDSTLGISLGTLYVGFVTSNPNNRLFAKVLKTVDVFVLPVGKTNAVAFAGVSSQNPGVIGIANAVFGSMPAINPDVLPKAFKLDRKMVEYIQTQF
ncbi:hypothetical protein V6N11_063392 [Hibiscus sabdariffa]|uniref:Uncharacterized protein n=2 Tax=Hibiscus sabdariffa TaxID=183260 RepID=A0ABR2B286_9ROSI